MSKENTMVRTLANLRATLAYHENLYRQKLEPEITDSEFDALRFQLHQLEIASPGLAAAPAITEGAPMTKTVSHWRPMQTLASTINRATLHAFTDPHFVTDPSFGQVPVLCVEHKLDGLAVALHYVDGKLVRALTRGDYEQGEDITARVKSIDHIVLNLEASVEGQVVSWGRKVEVRGEIVVLHDHFAAWNTYAAKTDGRLYSNPRAMAAASMRSNSAAKIARMNPTLIVYDVEGLVGKELTHGSNLLWANRAGFQTVWSRCVDTSQSLDELLDDIERERPGFIYDIDGAVVKLVNLDKRKALGQNRTHPHWAMAFKFPAIEAFSEIKAILYQTGRTGIVTPVLKVVPVSLGGIVVKSVTLHNPAMMERLRIHIGDTAVIRRANDVVPQLVKVLSRSVGNLLLVPTDCPVCQTPLVDDGESRKRCPNALGCPAQGIASLVHFVGPLAVDIDGFGYSRTKMLYDKGLVRTPADFYRLTADVLSHALNISVTHATKLTLAVAVSKYTTLPRLIAGLGIPDVSTTTAQCIAASFDYDFMAIVHADEASLRKVPGISKVRAKSMERYFAINHDALMDLISQGISWPVTKPMPTEMPRPLDDLTITVTGRLTLPNGEGISRNRVWDHYRQLGATVISEVTHRSTHLIVGERPSPNKIALAKASGIPILTADAFQEQFALPPFIDPAF